MRENQSMNQKLQIILTEYNTLRDEMHRKFDFHTTLLAAYGTATIGFYTFLLNNKNYMDIILILPLLSLFFLFRFLWDQNIIHDISKYIEKDIEMDKIPQILGEIEKQMEEKPIEENKTKESSVSPIPIAASCGVSNPLGNESKSKLWLGWQNHYNEKSGSSKPYIPYWRFSALIIFVIFSILPQLVYNVIHILDKWAPSALEILVSLVFTHSSEIPSTALQPHVHLCFFLINICICYYIIRKIVNPYKSLKIERIILDHFGLKK